MLFLWFQATVLGIGLAPPVAEGNNNNTVFVNVWEDNRLLV